MKNIKASDNKYDWVVFAFSYFDIAKLACQELLDNRENKHSKSESMPNFVYNPSDLFISIVFNIKHGMEVFIKTLSIFAYGEYDMSHDISDLFEIVQKKLKKLNIQPLSYNGDNVTQEDIDNLPKNLTKIEKSIKYFYTLDFLKKKIASYYMVSDTMNDIFRYPDNAASVRFNWDSILDNNIDVHDIKEIFKKLLELHDLFSRHGYIFSVIDAYSTKDM
ncbi:MAG: hypothetical protein A3J55_01405 [Candidatus Ryanbacteria bacterium RIFCSPHIGHO2_02_FULL_45_17b]|uniref:HEPN domain-containing protein n=1 Tax=Candidatus Ryanbacteria bacterium RIFCSPHIGHO2_01_FULL_45_22 TaxID=1802114 RepID=A0A1G2G2Q1_9BACT|nr:MAG: hypothetical protein A2719_03875 [Candidatus Ryanbacteria bacterium RIFCSPHIGHO2_01_FULL_45_22]OGZ47190.1 MAG: hypothetical protein A3J55_01405 [Candidatus Ryanbacteria bacterium RIFCSPHIGHO2_02_FULL_45_17b]